MCSSYIPSLSLFLSASCKDMYNSPKDRPSASMYCCGFFVFFEVLSMAILNAFLCEVDGSLFVLSTTYGILFSVVIWMISCFWIVRRGRNNVYPDLASTSCIFSIHLLPAQRSICKSVVSMRSSRWCPVHTQTSFPIFLAIFSINKYLFFLNSASFRRHPLRLATTYVFSLAYLLTSSSSRSASSLM